MEEQFREVSDKIRLSGLSISDYLKQNGTAITPERNLRYL
jgi:hypothetical protein